MFSGAHLHLLVNHAPIFGCLFATALLLVSFFTAKDVLRRTAFVLLIATAIGGQIAVMSGEPAEDAIRGYPGTVRRIGHEHEEMGEKARTIAIVVGVLALGALIKWRRTPVPAGVAGAMLLIAAFTSGAFVYAGLLGGRVRHTEIRPGVMKGDELKIEPRPQRRPDSTSQAGG